MVEDIKVSVLVYVLNGKKYIEKCIRSVLNQTLKEIELIVIDGGSTDGTLDLIKEICKSDQRVHIIYSDPGVGLQFNTGLKAARGEYIGICESDDYILPDMYDKQYAVAKKYQLDMLRADAIHFFEDGKGREIHFTVKLSKENDLYGQVLDLTGDNCVLKLGVNSFWSGLYRREFLLKENLFMNETKGAAYQDTSFAFLTSVKAKRVMLSRDAFYCYRLDNPNSSVNLPQRITMLNHEYQLLKKRLLKEGLFEIYKEIYLSWKINGYLGFYDSLSENLRDSYEKIMYDDIQKELESGRFLENELSEKERKVTKKIKESISVLHQYLHRIYTELYVTKQRLESIGAQEDIVIFGNGDMGKLVSLYLKYNKKKIVAYMDNNQELWGRMPEDIVVMEPEQAVQQFSNSIYIISNVANYQNMRDQLISLSVKEENMIICNDYGFFFKHILLKSLKDMDKC